MSLTVNSITADVSKDIRGVLTTSGTDLTLITGWIDRIHKDLLHTGRYSHYTQKTVTFTMTPGLTLYALPIDTIRTISAYDVTLKNALTPLVSYQAPGTPPIQNPISTATQEKPDEYKTWTVAPEAVAAPFYQAETTVSLLAANASVALPLGVREVRAVYDRTTNRVLQPLMDISKFNEMPPGLQRELYGPLPLFYKFIPTTSLFVFPAAISNTSLEVYYETQQGPPAFWRQDGAGNLEILPAPSIASSIIVWYEAAITTLVNGTDLLLTPEDARDAMVAGVMWLASFYLKRPEDAQVWLQLYQQSKGFPI